MQIWKHCMYREENTEVKIYYKFIIMKKIYDTSNKIDKEMDAIKIPEIIPNILMIDLTTLILWICVQL